MIEIVYIKIRDGGDLPHYQTLIDLQGRCEGNI